MLSMTGWGAAEAGWSGGRVAVSVRTVNHRFLDVVFRMPAGLVPLERELTQFVRSRLERGRVELTVEESGEASARLGELDLDVASRLGEMARRLVDAGLADRGLGAADFLAYPQVVRSASAVVGEAPNEGRRAAVLQALGAALDAVVSARQDEGRSLQGDLEEIVEELGEGLRSMRIAAEAGRPERTQRYLERLRAILRDAGGQDLPPDGDLDARVLQEAGVLAEKTDVTEELDRIGAHLVAVRQAMAGEDPCGKRLDFLAQELLREHNTVAAKCRDSELSARVIDAKVLCERFREQVQNVE